MGIDKSLLKAILEQLEPVFPNSIDRFEDIQEEEKDRNKILVHLTLLKDDELIECKPIEESGIIVEYAIIKITSKGIRYLSELSKSS